MPEIKTISPYDGSVVAVRPEATVSEIEACFERAQAAFEAEQALSLGKFFDREAIERRIAIASTFLDLLTADADALAKDISIQMGRPIRYCLSEITTAVARGRWQLSHAMSALSPLPGDASGGDGLRREVVKVGKGVVVVVGAWNYPWLVTINGVLPALVAGNAVILKHSPQTPLVAEAFTRMYTEAGLPQNLLQHLHIGNPALLTQNLCTSKYLTHISFTGSVDAGTAVERAVVGSNGPGGPRKGYAGVTLELGGKDGCWVRGDADVGLAAAGIVDGGMFNSGQSCCAVERVYVDAAVYDAFVAACVAEAKAYVLGDPADNATTLGPCVSRNQANLARAHIQDALARGAKALLPTHQLDNEDTNFVTPQILVDVPLAARVMTEETFGPVLPIIKVDGGDAEGVRLVNDSDFGLTASVWSKDLDGKAEEVCAQLDAGTVFLNRADYPDPSLVWTGYKLSGRGASMGGSIGFEAWVKLKSVHLKRV
ncbi:hypothetical protein PYCC9005_000819 [Savitreella phatthalungensis]